MAKSILEELWNPQQYLKGIQGPLGEFYGKLGASFGEQGKQYGDAGIDNTPKYDHKNHFNLESYFQLQNHFDVSDYFNPLSLANSYRLNAIKKAT